MAKRKKQNNSKRVSFLIYAFFTICIISFVLHLFYKKDQTVYSFGVEKPGDYTVLGIDLSKHQGEVDWDDIKNVKTEGGQVDFVFIKATEGLKNVDEHFSHNWKQASVVKIPHGAYHFFISTKSGRKQAENFIKTVKLSPGDLPPVLDIEQLYGVSPGIMRNEVKLWLKQVEEHYNVKPIIYTYIDFYEKYLGKDFDGYPLWIAHYLQKDQPRISRNWSFWQHSEKGTINGINTKVDLNVFNGDKGDFEKLLIQ